MFEHLRAKVHKQSPRSGCEREQHRSRHSEAATAAQKVDAPLGRWRTRGQYGVGYCHRLAPWSPGGDLGIARRARLLFRAPTRFPRASRQRHECRRYGLTHRRLAPIAVRRDEPHPDGTDLAPRRFKPVTQLELVAAVAAHRGAKVTERTCHYAPAERTAAWCRPGSNESGSSARPSPADEGSWNYSGSENASMSSRRRQRATRTRNPPNLGESQSIKWLVASGESNGASHYLVRDCNRDEGGSGTITWPQWHTGSHDIGIDAGHTW